MLFRAPLFLGKRYGVDTYFFINKKKRKKKYIIELFSSLIKNTYLEKLVNYIALGPSYNLLKYMAFCPSHILPKIKDKVKA